MKIVYNILGTFNSGGMERVLANKANYLVNRGYDVVIITTDQKGRKPYFDLNSKIDCFDLNINYREDIDKNIFFRLINYLKKQWVHKRLLKKKLFEIKADIVISMFDFDAPFLYKIKDGSKKILEIHFSRLKRIQYRRNGILKFIDLYRSRQDIFIAKQYDHFVVLTNEDKQLWNNVKKITVIPNANTFISRNSASLTNKKVIAVGRYDYQKGFDDLIKAWKIINHYHRDWILNIYGDGPLRQYLTDLVKQMKLEDHVFLEFPSNRIQEVYLEHSVLAMTSRYEGFGMVLLEAQACGLPLVAYDCKCGPNEIIVNNYNGFLIEVNNIQSMAENLMKLIEDADLRHRMGGNSLNRSVVFSEDRIMQKWIELFNSLIS